MSNAMAAAFNCLISKIAAFTADRALGVIELELRKHGTTCSAITLKRVRSRRSAMR